MPSNTWTIVGLTLTLLICGCSDSDVVKVNAPDAVGVVAALPKQSAADSQHVPLLPRDAGVVEPLEVPPGFQPPEVELPSGHLLPFGGGEIMVPVVRFNSDKNTDAVQLLGFVNPVGLKSLLSKTGELKVVRVADEASDVQVLAVETPAITVQRGDRQMALNLFELPGFRNPAAVFDVAGKQFGGQDVRGLGAAHAPSFPLGMPGTSAEPNFPRMPAADVPNVPVAFPGLNSDGSPSDPTGISDLGRTSQRPGLPPELPGLDGSPVPGLPQVPGAEALPNLPSAELKPQTSILEQE